MTLACCGLDIIPPAPSGHVELCSSENFSQKLYPGAGEYIVAVVVPRALSSSSPSPLTRTGAALSHFTASVPRFGSEQLCLEHLPLTGKQDAPCSALALFTKKPAPGLPGMCDAVFPK